MPCPHIRPRSPAGTVMMSILISGVSRNGRCSHLVLNGSQEFCPPGDGKTVACLGRLVWIKFHYSPLQLTRAFGVRDVFVEVEVDFSAGAIQVCLVEVNCIR